MPKVNGIEVLQRIKSDVRTMRIPVVMFTSSTEYSDIQECYNLGVNGYVVKPTEFDKFHKTLYDPGLFWIVVNQPPP